MYIGRKKWQKYTIWWIGLPIHSLLSEWVSMPGNISGIFVGKILLIDIPPYHHKERLEYTRTSCKFCVDLQHTDLFTISQLPESEFFFVVFNEIIRPCVSIFWLDIQMWRTKQSLHLHFRSSSFCILQTHSLHPHKNNLNLQMNLMLDVINEITLMNAIISWSLHVDKCVNT